MGKWQTVDINGQTIAQGDNRSLAECIEENRLRIGDKTTETILSTGIDTATQQNAALGIYPHERCEAIKSYIAACRNEYLRCKALILAATTNDMADSVQFTAPAVPEGM